MAQASFPGKGAVDIAGMVFNDDGDDNAGDSDDEEADEPAEHAADADAADANAPEAVRAQSTIPDGARRGPEFAGDKLF